MMWTPSVPEGLLSTSKSWFRLPFVYRNRAERRESPALAAFHWEGPALRQNPVGNISGSGAYVLTKEVWEPGELVSLTLQRSGTLEPSPQRRFTVQARAVRRDRNGVGLAFLMPRGAEVCLWQSALHDRPQTEPEDVVREFRIATALSFVQRIAPQAVGQARLLLREGLSNFRLDHALEIAIHAEELLGIEGSPKQVFVDPAVVLRILDDGSWAETEWIQHYWSGVLATSCTESRDNSSLSFVSLLSQLTTIQARLFTASCMRSKKFVDGRGQMAAHPLTFEAEELTQIAGTHDLVHIERDVQHLVELGLAERRVKWKFFSLIDNAEVTPTATALELFARCKSYRGDPAEFYAGALVESPMVAAD